MTSNSAYTIGTTSAVTGTITNDDGTNSKGNFTQMLNELGAFESGKLTGDPDQYVAINQLHFVGKYQFGEGLLKYLGYYNGDNTPYPGSAKNDWIGIWSGKDGVSKMGLALNTDQASYPYYPTQTFDASSFLGNVTAQENAIRGAFGKNLTTIIGELSNAGKTINDYLGQSRTDQNGQTFTITMSGIMAGTHLCGAVGVANYLKTGTVTADENGTSILKYISTYGGYDTTFGTKNVDTITGTTYNDVMVGFAGNDTLTGGAGADRFRFYASTEGIDTITDFVSGSDKIELYQSGFGGGQVLWAPFSSDQFTLGTSAAQWDDRIIYNSSSGDLFFDSDGSGNQAQVKLANLSNKPALTATDIVVF